MKTLHKRLTTATLAALMAASISACGSKKPASDATVAITPEMNHSDVLDSIESAGKENAKADVGEYVTPAEADFTWEEVDGGVSVTGYSGEARAIIIPAQLGGKDVVSIGKKTFAKSALTGIKLPDTVHTVGEQAFWASTSLKEFEPGSGLKVIDKKAVMLCPALSKITLNEGLTEIRESAFSGSGSLQEVTLPSTLTVLEPGAFYGTGISEITIPGSVKVIGYQAFQDSKNLKTVVVEEGVEEIEHTAFQICEKLERVDLPASVKKYGSSVFANSPNAVLYAPAGSAAEAYAEERGYKFEAK